MLNRENTIHVLKNNDITIDGFLDNNRNFLNATYFGKTIFNPKYLKNLINQQANRILVIICKSKTETSNQIIQQLKSNGLRNINIKILNKVGFIRSEPFGRTKLFRTTKSFSDYFGISQDPQLMKQDLTKGGLAIPIQNSSKKFITN